MEHSAPISWSNRPDDLSTTAGYDLIRCPASGVHNAIITSADILGVKVHYYHGRTRPHLNEFCPACDDRNPWRWRGYLSACHPKSLNSVALEITAPCVNALDDYLKHWGSLRGAVIMLWRPSHQPNGRISCRVEQSRFPVEQLPAAIDLEALLLKLWEIQPHMTAPELKQVMAAMHTKKNRIPNSNPKQIGTNGH